MYRLRWYFDYFTRPPYFGVWGYADPKRPAWCHAYEGIARVLIQGKDPHGNIKTLAECSGQDFMNLSWLAEARFSPVKFRGAQKLPTRIMGIMISTRSGQIKVFVDGSVQRDNHVYDTVNFATYGR